MSGYFNVELELAEKPRCVKDLHASHPLAFNRQSLFRMQCSPSSLDPLHIVTVGSIPKKMDYFPLENCPPVQRPESDMFRSRARVLYHQRAELNVAHAECSIVAIPQYCSLMYWGVPRRRCGPNARQYFRHWLQNITLA
jgi:hypothetical protein